jgi:alkanesulfonate monooxygenase SsuD/methylene tetrahydromethanopterin reductase-like flavin-dependent oxidoreductase (luciferase family)
MAARRIGIGFDWQGSIDRERSLERVKVADQVGVDSVWAAEAWGRDAFTLLVQAAEVTKNVQLGTSIVNIYSRTPAALAQHFGTLDELSEGRMIVGLGNSGPQVIEHFHGIPFQPAFRRMRETVEIMQILFSGEPLNYDGELFKLERGFTMRFETYRKKLPFYLATLNPKSVQMTAEISDGWRPVMIPIDRLKDEIDQVNGWVSAAGKDPADFTVRAPGGVTVAHSAEHVQKARMTQAGTLAFYCARMGDFYYRQLSRQGYEDEANAVRAAWKDGGAQAGAQALPQEMLDQFGFVGNTEECIARLDQEAEAGTKLHSVTVMEDDPDEMGRILESLVG